MSLKTNGTTFSFNGSGVNKLRRVRFSEAGEEIDVTDLSDSKKVIELGTIAEEMTVDLLGVPGFAVGDTGDAVIAFADGETKTITGGVCVSREKTGELNGELMNTCVFKPHDA